MKNFVIWSKILIIFGCHSVVRVQNVGESTVTSIQHCGSSFSIKCPNDEMINVLSANYGRTNNTICQGGKLKTRNCVLDTSIVVVRERCQGQSKCTISTSDFRTDPCPGVSKYIEVNYTCEPKASASCSSANTCDEKTEVCVDKNGGIVCECAENYQRGNDRICQAVTCENSPTTCNAITHRCKNLYPGIQCVCAEGYMENNVNECIAETCANSPTVCNANERCEDMHPGIQCVCADGYVKVNNQCIVMTCENSATSCNATTQRCEDLNPGIQCVCAEGYMEDSNKQCIAVTCENTETTCNVVSERCEDLIPGIQCVCAEGYAKDNNSQCIAMTCESSSTSCNAVTQLCNDLNPGIRCVCAEGYMEDNGNECVAMTCENSASLCNAVTQRCVDSNPGIDCVCREGYTRDCSNECIAMTCENANTCNCVTQRCEDLNPGIQCVCAEGYVEDDTNQCIARTCENSITTCNTVTQRCENLNPGFQCVCAEGYTEDNDTKCIAETCENAGTTCNAVTQRCVDLNPGVQCICAENYMEDNSSQCIAVTCQNADTTCDAITQSCEDLHPGVQCVCAENYMENNSSQCIAVTCANAGTTCDAVTQRCEDLHPGVRCVCADNHIEDNSSQCTAMTCQNTGTTCDAVTQRCVDLHPGVQCVCAENYLEDNSSQCIAVTCQNSGTTCDADTQRCVDLYPGVRCVCADNYMEDNSSQCIAMTCQNAGTTCDAVTQRCEDLHPGIQCVCAENYMGDNSSQCIAVTCVNSGRACTPVTERCVDLNPGIQCVCTEGYMKDVNNKCIEVKEAHSTTEVPENGIRCPADTIDIGVIVVSFPPAETGEEVKSIESCSNLLSQNQRQPLATRVCNQVWQEPKLQNCFNVDTPEKQLDALLQLNLTNTNVREVSRSFALYIYQFDNITARLLELIIKYLAKIVAVGSASFEVTDVVVGTVSFIMTVSEEILDETRGVSLVIPLMEKQVTNVIRNEQNYSQSLQNVAVSALKMQKSMFDHDFTFIDRVTALTENTRGEELVEETSVTIPNSVMELIDKVYPNNTDVPISFVTYEDPRLFRKDKSQASENRNGTQEYIGSYVISSTVELPDVTIDDLPQNSSVIIKFSDLMLKERDNASKAELLCVYWKYTSNDGQGEWSQAGCKKLSTGFENVTCSCNHLTSFAVLVRMRGEEETRFHFVLQLITMIGCIISTIGLFLSLMCMIIIRKVRVKQQTRVHFNLCLALIGLYLSFLFGIDQADKPRVCRRMTSLIYFFCLSSMAWMSVEAFYIYKLIWKCKRNNIKHLIPVGALFGWGLPGIAAIIIYSLDNTHDYEAKPDYCFLHPGHVLLYGFLLELLVMFLYNSVIFILVTYRLVSRKIEVWNREYKRRERIIRFKSTVLFWFLLGISWIFGFLATFAHPAVIVFQIIFCVLLSLQGFFMFYMLILQNPEMRKRLSTISSLKTHSLSLQLGARATSEVSSKEQKIKREFASFDKGNNESFL